MPDAPSPWELQRRIEAQEHACERRAGDHLDVRLYTSERDGIRDQLRTLDRKVAELRAALAAERQERQEAAREAEKAQRDTRRWLLGVLVFPIIVTLVGIVVGVQL